MIRKKRIKEFNSGGFTLIELVCVIAILAILTAVAVPSYQALRDRSAREVAVANARSEYTFGKSQYTMVEAGLLEEEEMEDSAYDPDTDTATWEGEINGKVYIGIAAVGQKSGGVGGGADYSGCGFLVSGGKTESGKAENKGYLPADRIGTGPDGKCSGILYGTGAGGSQD